MRSASQRIRSENRQFRHVMALKCDRRLRWRQREFFVEGVRAINRALEEGWEINSLLYSGQRGLSRWAEEILRHAPDATRLDLAPDLLAALSDKEEPSELLAVLAMRENDPARISVVPGLLVVGADRPVSPGNLGGVLRCCDAFGAHGLLMTGHACDPYDPRTIRASAGSFFSVPAVRLGSHRDVQDWLAAARAELGEVRVVGTSAHARTSALDFDFGPATLLVLGNERSGLSTAYREFCDALVSIPMLGKATSLNVTSAASILLYEIQRRRIIAGSKPARGPEV